MIDLSEGFGTQIRRNVIRACEWLTHARQELRSVTSIPSATGLVGRSQLARRMTFGASARYRATSDDDSSVGDRRVATGLAGAGPREADVTEGSGGVWERLQHDWSDPNHVELTTTDSNVFGGASRLRLNVTIPADVSFRGHLDELIKSFHPDPRSRCLGVIWLCLLAVHTSQTARSRKGTGDAGGDIAAL